MCGYVTVCCQVLSVLIYRECFVYSWHEMGNSCHRFMKNGGGDRMKQYQIQVRGDLD
jgi:hypothetical protein